MALYIAEATASGVLDADAVVSMARSAATTSPGMWTDSRPGWSSLPTFTQPKLGLRAVRSRPADWLLATAGGVFIHDIAADSAAVVAAAYLAFHTRMSGEQALGTITKQPSASIFSSPCASPGADVARYGSSLMKAESTAHAT